VRKLKGSMSAQTQPHLTPEQYLEIDRASEVRNEYYNGRMWAMGDGPSAMAGGTYRHSKLTHRISHLLANALEGRPCEVSGSGIPVCTAPDGLYTYPDLVVVAASRNSRTGVPTHCSTRLL